MDGLVSLAVLLRERGNRMAAREAYGRALALYERHRPDSLTVVEAMARVRDDPATQHPFHWAAFRLLGEVSGWPPVASPSDDQAEVVGGRGP